MLTSDASRNLAFTVVTSTDVRRRPPLEGNAIEFCPITPLVGRPGGRLHFYTFVLQLTLWLLIHMRKFGLVHCVKAGPEAVTCSAIARLFRKSCIVKVVQEELRGILGARGLRGLFRKLRWRLLKSATIWIAISSEIERELLELGVPRERIRSIPNGTDGRQFHPPKTVNERTDLRRELGLPVDAVVGLFVGAISKRKGVLELVQAIRQLVVSTPFLLVLCGPDYGEAHLLKTEDPRIRYEGTVDDVAKYMRAADFLVLPSWSEGLPNVLLEAAISGLPMIASDIGGNTDVIQHGRTGLLFPVGNVDELRKCLNIMIEDEGLRQQYGSEARTQALKSYELNVVAAQYGALYMQLLEADENPNI